MTNRRGGSRGTSNNRVEEQKSNYLLNKPELKAFFALLHRCSTYLKSASELKIKIYENMNVSRSSSHDYA